MLGAAVEKNETSASCYIDVRLLGSAQLMSDSDRSVNSRCVGVFKDMIAEIQTTLLDLATTPDRDFPGNATEAVSLLADALRAMTGAVVEKQVSTDRTTSTGGRRRRQSGSGLRVSARELAASTHEEAADRVAESYTQVFRDTVVFAEVSRLLDNALDALGIDHFRYSSTSGRLSGQIFSRMWLISSNALSCRRDE